MVVNKDLFYFSLCLSTHLSFIDFHLFCFEIDESYHVGILELSYDAPCQPEPNGKVKESDNVVDKLHQTRHVDAYPFGSR